MPLKKKVKLLTRTVETLTHIVQDLCNSQLQSTQSNSNIAQPQAPANQPHHQSQEPAILTQPQHPMNMTQAATAAELPQAHVHIPQQDAHLFETTNVSGYNQGFYGPVNNTRQIETGQYLNLNKRPEHSLSLIHI